MLTKEQIMDVMIDIQKRIPERWRKSVIKQVKIAPDVEFIVLKALKSKKISEEKKKELRAAYRTGEFSKTEWVVDEKIQLKIDKFVDREIAKLTKQGKLPTKEELTKLYVKENPDA